MGAQRRACHHVVQLAAFRGLRPRTSGFVASRERGFALSAAVTQPLGGLFAAVTQLSEIIAGARNNLLAPRNPWNLDPSDVLADPFGKI